MALTLHTYRPVFPQKILMKDGLVFGLIDEILRQWKTRLVDAILAS